MTAIRARLLDDAGTGHAIVYVPGIDGSGELLLGTTERLRRVARLVRLRYETIDAGGEPEIGYDGLAGSVVAVLDELGIESCALLAESFGGAVAMHVALAHRERVSRLELVNTFPHFSRRTNLCVSRTFAPLVPKWLFTLGRNVSCPWSLFGKRREADAIRRFREIGGTCFDRGYRHRLAMLAVLDLRPLLSEIAQPVTIYAGTEDRVVDSVPQARAMQQLLPNANVEIVDGGGHLILPLASLPWERWLCDGA